MDLEEFIEKIHNKIELSSNEQTNTGFDMRDIKLEFSKLLESAEMLKVKNTNLTFLDTQAQVELNNNYKLKRQSTLLPKEDVDD